MKHIYKLIFSLFFLVFLNNSLFAQGGIDLTNAQTSSEWNKFKGLELVDIYYKNLNCTFDDGLSFQYLLFKVVNTSNQSIEITWEFKTYNNNQEIVKSPDDMQVSLIIDANSMKEGNCQITDNDKLKLLVSEQNGPAMITSVDLVNIKVSAK